MPTKLVTFELNTPLPEFVEDAENYEHVWLIVMRRGVPLGHVTIDNCRTPVRRDQMVGELLRQLGSVITEGQEYQLTEAFGRTLEPAKSAPEEENLSGFAGEPELAGLLPDLKPERGQSFFLSIVICTRDRPHDLRKCLGSLAKLEAGRHRLEVIVVDNNPASGQTALVVAGFPNVRYETEARPGVAYARNQGLRAAQGQIVAYIDDDVVVPPGWPAQILAPFADERVMCVSGLVLPVELETYSQEMYERYGGLGRGYRPRIFDTVFFNHSKRHVVPTWELGGTANVAIRKSVIPQTGMFDETLGPGLPTGVGEDIYMFYRILKFGHLCYYQPAAYVWHKHRQDIPALKRQLYGYNKGQTSYQLRTLVSDGDKRAYWQLFWDLPVWHARRVVRILRGRHAYPLNLVWEEVRGNLVGPYAFYKAVKMHRRLNGPDANPIKSASAQPAVDNASPL
jgi:GT2 family glycosyltransferase